MGVYVFESGFGSLELLHRRNYTRREIMKKYRKKNVTNIFIEERIPGPHSKYVPFQYRFFMFNGVVGGVRAEAYDDVKADIGEYCELFVDEDFNPMIRRWPPGTDSSNGSEDYDGPPHVCLYRAQTKEKHPLNATADMSMSDNGDICLNPRRLTSPTEEEDYREERACKTFPKPRNWSKMVETAKHLSQRIGIFMRIDLLESADGEIFLVEFTPYPDAGQYHCFAKQDPLTGCIDPCHLGRLWKEGNGGEYNEGEGGPKTKAPDYLVGWWKMSFEEKCKVALSLSEHGGGLDLEKVESNRANVEPS
jgi:hypothetical protein